MKVQAEYIWLDGNQPQQLRSKTKVFEAFSATLEPPVWGFDGSSTNQAEGHFSDCLLKPVFWVPDPIRQLGYPVDCLLVLCEVLNPDGTPHASNTRHRLVQTVERLPDAKEAWFGFEQEYTLFGYVPRTGSTMPLAWTQRTNLGPQGPYYCGVGSNHIFGRKVVERHTQACLEAGLDIAGTNAEVMPGQWEFQIGAVPAPSVADQLWLARWLLRRVAEDEEVSISFAPKPMAGNWNGAGCHTNFSTAPMREDGGLALIEAAAEKLRGFHQEHIAVYGPENDKRLTGKHETCDIDTFRWGVGDRGASIRIPAPVATDGKGYLEDRRPAANCDPYQVCTALLESVLGDGFKR